MGMLIIIIQRRHRAIENAHHIQPLCVLLFPSLYLYLSIPVPPLLRPVCLCVFSETKKQTDKKDNKPKKKERRSNPHGTTKEPYEHPTTTRRRLKKKKGKRKDDAKSRRCALKKKLPGKRER